MNAVQIVEVLIGDADRKYAYRSVTMADFIDIRRNGVRPKYNPEVRGYPLKGGKPLETFDVIWFSDDYQETRGYNDQLTIRFPWPIENEEISDSGFVCFTPIPVSVVEVEVDLTGEWVPIRKATIRQNMVVKR